MRSTNYGSLDEFVANNSQKVFRIVDCNKEAQDCPLHNLWSPEYDDRAGR